MPVTKKKKIKKELITLSVGDITLDVHPVPDNEVVKANARIQKKVQPIFPQIKKARRNAAITASTIVLNA
jgi:hypothetical protein